MPNNHNHYWYDGDDDLECIGLVSENDIMRYQLNYESPCCGAKIFFEKVMTADFGKGYRPKYRARCDVCLQELFAAARKRDEGKE